MWSSFVLQPLGNRLAIFVSGNRHHFDLEMTENGVDSQNQKSSTGSKRVHFVLRMTVGNLSLPWFWHDDDPDLFPSFRTWQGLVLPL